MSPVSKEIRRHRGSIRTARRVSYLEIALASALADPDFAKEVALLGNLFPCKRGKKVSVVHLKRALAACHPGTGKLLRKRVNTGTRREGQRRVSNVCHGFDITLSVEKSLSVAALVFGDAHVNQACLDAMRQGGRWLTKQMDRRIRKGGVSKEVASDRSAAFFLPEKSGRSGQPHLHAHLIFPNLTTFEEDGRTKYCAAHFKRIARLATTAQRRVNRQIFGRLKKAGYQVELVNGVCRLPSVSRELCEQFSPTRKIAEGDKNQDAPARRRQTKRWARLREDAYLRKRPAKVLRPLAEWQSLWEKEITPEALKAHEANYRAARKRRPVVTEPPSVIVTGPATFHPDHEPAVAALSKQVPEDEALEAKLPPPPKFTNLGAAVRARLQRELGPEAKYKLVEIQYECPEGRPDLAEHNMALATLLRLIFPRLFIHQRYITGTEPKFTAIGGAATSPQFAALVAATAHALDQELGQPHVRANWPAVLRWLHTEIANRPAEPIVKVPRAKPVGPSTPKLHAEKPVELPSRAIVPQSTTPPPDSPAPATDSEMEMLM